MDGYRSRNSEGLNFLIKKGKSKQISPLFPLFRVCHNCHPELVSGSLRLLSY
ncbi:MAG: hypothetical protein SCARUB_00652 [Candidatus Scalindua rubra]|uniref:Uncharacterized protein n=1 Tax=Candidatus Scalindua rubra TaxID=1872076 RepID=A0A1E3XEX1_9BACT|nr:MAG: hypothetical protein SCARUB_00652 [Candidatus Scalindua rubra]